MRFNAAVVTFVVFALFINVITGCDDRANEVANLPQDVEDSYQPDFTDNLDSVEFDSHVEDMEEDSSLPEDVEEDSTGDTQDIEDTFDPLCPPMTEENFIHRLHGYVIENGGTCDASPDAFTAEEKLDCLDEWASLVGRSRIEVFDPGSDFSQMAELGEVLHTTAWLLNLEKDWAIPVEDEELPFYGNHPSPEALDRLIAPLYQAGVLPEGLEEIGLNGPVSTCMFNEILDKDFDGDGTPNLLDYHNGCSGVDFTVTRAEVAVTLQGFYVGRGGVCPSAPAQATYVDVPEEHFAFEAIECFTERNVFTGYADGTFKPDQHMNRAELAKVLWLVIAHLDGQVDTPPDLPQSTIDASHSEWFGTYVTILNEQELLPRRLMFKPAENVKQCLLEETILLRYLRRP